jgi:hypothetical protein
MEKIEPIRVNGTRILGPYEVDLFRDSISKNYLTTIFDVCLWSGMRYVEVQRLYDNPEWWLRARKAIHLPEEAQRKTKRKQRERYIHPIPPQLENILGYFFENKKPPSQSAWNENLLRWGEKSDLDIQGLSSKSTRKSIESWMIAAEIPLNIICLRQGHDSLTSMNHYQGLPFTEAEKTEIKRRLAGWI